jgi:plastocyanin
MRRASICAAALFWACLRQASASEVSGRITIEKGDNARIVSAAVYDLRGIAVANSAPPAKASTGYDRVAIWLESNTPTPAPRVKAVMEQRNRQLGPNLLVVPAGSTIEFPNLDPIFHNIFSLSRAQSFDLGYYAEGRTRSVDFLHPGIVQVYCHVHPNMHGVIVVTASRWFGKPAQDGAFSWPDVPPGKYRMCVWQKSVGVIRRKIVVPQSGALHVNMTIPDEGPENE